MDRKQEQNQAMVLSMQFVVEMLKNRHAERLCMFAVLMLIEANLVLQFPLDARNFLQVLGELFFFSVTSDAT